jgi:hypothetical protein
LSPRRSESAPASATEILEYFVRHPQAADDSEGVARWRLREGAVRSVIADTNCALAWLVTRGFLREQSVRGSDSIFSLNQENAAAAQRFLATERRRGVRSKR